MRGWFHGVFSGKPLEVGGTVSCCMLDADLAECCVVVSLSRPLVEAARGEGNGEARGPGKRAKRLRKTKQETVSTRTHVHCTAHVLVSVSAYIHVYFMRKPRIRTILVLFVQTSDSTFAHTILGLPVQYLGLSNVLRKV